MGRRSSGELGGYVRWVGEEGDSVEEGLWRGVAAEEDGGKSVGGVGVEEMRGEDEGVVGVESKPAGIAVEGWGSTPGCKPSDPVTPREGKKDGGSD